MMGTHTNKDAPNILGLIPVNSVGAEIGVWFGNSSQIFLNKGLKELHLVDSWSVEPYKNNSEMPYDQYLAKYQRITGEFSEAGFTRYYEMVYKDVITRFGNDPRVKIHRMTSDEWFEKTDVELDWIYIDGDHSFEGCYRDLNNALKVVKQGGRILGDDYMWPEQAYGKRGVTKAVDKFREENPQLKSMTQYGFTQYVIKVY